MESPPPEVRAAIEKSVAFVKKNGPGFEERLRKNDTQNQFSFLNPDDKYHQYYQQCLKEPQEQNIENEPTAQPSRPQRQAEKPTDLLFMTEIPPISTRDLEIVKATALYSACNPPKNTDALLRYMERKGNRSQFAFLNKNHTLHGLYQSYVKQYGEIVKKSRGEKDAASIDAAFRTREQLFRAAYNRAAYEVNHKIKRKTQEASERSHQKHFASIDWQDFSFVKKFSFTAVDEVKELPKPLKRSDLMVRSLDSRAKVIELKAEDKPVDKTEESEKIGDEKEKVTQEESVGAKAPKGMKIRAAGESRLKRKPTAAGSSTEKLIECPITGQHIPEHQFDTHLKTLLRDPRYKEQQENFVRKNFTHASNLTNDQVYENIKRLVKKRGGEEAGAQNKRVKGSIGP